MASFKPHLHPIEHLSKYPSSDSTKTSATAATATASTDGNGNNNNNNSNNPHLHPNLLGAHLMGSIAVPSSRQTFLAVDPKPTEFTFDDNSNGNNNDSNNVKNSGSSVKGKTKSPGSISKSGHDDDFVQLDNSDG